MGGIGNMTLSTDVPPPEVDESGLDRRLGDEWIDWKGGVEEGGGCIREGKGLFLLLSLGVAALGVSAALLFWFLISPRLMSIGSRLYGVLRVLLVGAVLVSVGGYVLTMASALLERGVVLRHGIRQRLLNALVPWTIRMGRLAGISRDRVSNSFVQVSNGLARSSAKPVSPGRLLLLLPRCLTGEVRRRVLELGRSFGCRIATASGGTVARLEIEKMRPEAIITMACERDLVSGIQDVAAEIPVIAIPNRRPNGPCKNTEVDPRDVESAVRLYVGSGAGGGEPVSSREAARV